MARPVLKCQHLGIQFGGLKAVDDFNMEIGESELVGLIGPNGAGKTTVFNLITGVYKPTEGSLYLNGERMNGKKTHQIVHAGIARTFQNIRLFKKMTVIENVKAAMLEELTYNMPQAIFRTKAYWQQEAASDSPQGDRPPGTRRHRTRQRAAAGGAPFRQGGPGGRQPALW